MTTTRRDVEIHTSAGRCCLCFQQRNDWQLKPGQQVALDGMRTLFLCHDHAGATSDPSRVLIAAEALARFELGAYWDSAERTERLLAQDVPEGVELAVELTIDRSVKMWTAKLENALVASLVDLLGKRVRVDARRSGKLLIHVDPQDFLKINAGFVKGALTAHRVTEVKVLRGRRAAMDLRLGPEARHSEEAETPAPGLLEQVLDEQRRKASQDARFAMFMIEVVAIPSEQRTPELITGRAERLPDATRAAVESRVREVIVDREDPLAHWIASPEPGIYCVALPGAARTVSSRVLRDVLVRIHEAPYFPGADDAQLRLVCRGGAIECPAGDQRPMRSIIAQCRTKMQESAWALRLDEATAGLDSQPDQDVVDQAIEGIWHAVNGLRRNRQALKQVAIPAREVLRPCVDLLAYLEHVASEPSPETVAAEAGVDLVQKLNLYVGELAGAISRGTASIGSPPS